MSNLTLALAVLGALVLAAIVAHGAWQARRSGPRRPAPRPVATEPREPVLDYGASNDAGTAADLPAVVNGNEPPPERETAPEGEETSLVTHLQASPRRASSRIDALIDAIATLTLESPIAGELALAHLPTTRRAGSKPFLIEGQNAETGDWEMPLAGQRYREFQSGVQLANRTGAINEIEYSEFIHKLQGFADGIGAMVDFPDMLDVVGRARELDSFASQYDAQLAVHLRAREASWTVGYLQQHAARHGFVAGSLPGRLVLPSLDEGAPPVLSLTFASQAALADDATQAVLREVMLSFDVPQTDAASAPFMAWQASAQALALGMEADLVDDNGQALHPAGFSAIGEALGQLYEALASRDLAAGSPAARRLFS